jgi:hypothetical protein
MQLCEPLDEVLEGTAKPVKPPDNKNISLPDVVEGFVQAFALELGAANNIGEDFKYPFSL